MEALYGLDLAEIMSDFIFSDVWSPNMLESTGIVMFYLFIYIVSLFVYRKFLCPSDIAHPMEATEIMVFWPVLAALLHLSFSVVLAEPSDNVGSNDNVVLQFNVTQRDGSIITTTTEGGSPKETAIEPFPMSSFEWRWFSMQTNGQHAYGIYIAMQIWGCVAPFVMGTPLSAQMMFHHFISLSSLGLSLATGHMNYYGCLCLMCEVTNVFLNWIYMTKIKAKQLTAAEKEEERRKRTMTQASCEGESCGGEGDEEKNDLERDFYSNKKVCRMSQYLTETFPGPIFQMIMSVSLAISFIPFRLMLFPYVLYRLLSDMYIYIPDCKVLVVESILARKNSDYEVVENTSERIRRLQCTRDVNLYGDVLSLEMGLHIVVAMALFLLSTFWFYKIVLGAIVVVKGVISPKEKVEKKNQ